jgi:hypothetical protein
MPRYEYTGEDERVIPDLSLVVNKGDTFDAPDGFKATGVQLASSKTAPAVEKDKKELPKEEVKPSAPSDISAGA